MSQVASPGFAGLGVDTEAAAAVDGIGAGVEYPPEADEEEDACEVDDDGDAPVGPGAGELGRGGFGPGGGGGAAVVGEVEQCGEAVAEGGVEAFAVEVGGDVGGDPLEADDGADGDHREHGEGVVAVVGLVRVHRFPPGGVMRSSAATWARETPSPRRMSATGSSRRRFISSRLATM